MSDSSRFTITQVNDSSGFLRDRRVTQGAVVAALVIGGFTPSHPTGWTVTDHVATAVFAALVVAAASRARPWTLLVLTTVAATSAVAVDGWAARSAGWLSLGLVLLAVITDRAVPAVGAVAAVFAFFALSRLDGLGGTRWSAALMVV